MQKDWQERVSTRLYLKLTMKEVWKRSENVACDTVNMEKEMCKTNETKAYRMNSTKYIGVNIEPLQVSA